MKIFQNILNFVFPKKCSWCWIYWKNLCENCLENFSERSEKFFNLEKKYKNNYLFEKIYSPFFYKKNLILKKILKEIKYKNKFSKFSGLEEKIFLEFEKFLKSENIFSENKKIFLIPTPLHWKKFLKRWFNQSEIFCDFLEKKFNDKNIKKLNLIKKIKNTKAQAECSRNERLENLKWVFEINKKYKTPGLSWNILIRNKFNYNFFIKNPGVNNNENIFILIDDVLSTWSTIKNCGIEIKKHFPEWKVFWFVICSDKN